MAQTAGIAIGEPGKLFLLTAIRSMKFLRPVRPLQVISFRAEKIGNVGGLVQCAVEARVGEDLAAQGQVILVEAP
jgi:3-hydroxyacyl-[acyl-carrier-protein] dehydratase